MSTADLNANRAANMPEEFGSLTIRHEFQIGRAYYQIKDIMNVHRGITEVELERACILLAAASYLKSMEPRQTLDAFSNFRGAVKFGQSRKEMISEMHGKAAQFLDKCIVESISDPSSETASRRVALYPLISSMAQAEESARGVEKLRSSMTASKIMKTQGHEMRTTYESLQLAAGVLASDD